MSKVQLVTVSNGDEICFVVVVENVKDFIRKFPRFHIPDKTGCGVEHL